jgi:hypothetical protein
MMPVVVHRSISAAVECAAGSGHVAERQFTPGRRGTGHPSRRLEVTCAPRARYPGIRGPAQDRCAPGTPWPPSQLSRGLPSGAPVPRPCSSRREATLTARLHHARRATRTRRGCPGARPRSSGRTSALKARRPSVEGVAGCVPVAERRSALGVDGLGIGPLAESPPAVHPPSPTRLRCAREHFPEARAIQASPPPCPGAAHATRASARHAGG